MSPSSLLSNMWCSLTSGWWMRRELWRWRLNRGWGMRWNTPSLEKVIFAKRYHNHWLMLYHLFLMFNLVPQVNLTSMASLEICDSASKCWSMKKLSFLLNRDACVGIWCLIAFPFQTSGVWTQRRRPVHQRHHLSGRGAGRLWDGHCAFGWSQGSVDVLLAYFVVFRT